MSEYLKSILVLGGYWGSGALCGPADGVVDFFGGYLQKEGFMVLAYDFYAQSAPGLASDQGDVSLSFGCGRPGAPRTQSMQKFIPQVQRTCVADIFFSEENIEALQGGLRWMVYQESGGKIMIGNQSRDELSIIMRSIFLEHSRNLPYTLLEQVRELNKRVLDFCVPRVVAEAFAYQKYLVDISSQPVPPSYGLFTSRAGLRGAQN
jgi:hypothetical protein